MNLTGSYTEDELFFFGVSLNSYFMFPQNVTFSVARVLDLNATRLLLRTQKTIYFMFGL